MIVPMKKVTILITNRYIDSALKKLRTAGVLHVKKEAHQAGSEESAFLDDKLLSLNRALSDIENVVSTSEKDVSAKDIPGLIDEIHTFVKRKCALLDKLNSITQMLNWYRIWGGVSLESVAALQEAGWYVSLCIADKKSWQEISKNRNAYIVKRERSIFYIAVVTKSESEKIPSTQHMDFPDKEYSQLERERLDIIRQIKETDERIKYLASYKKQYENYKVELEKEVEFHKVRSSMVSEDEFRYLVGFCPYDAVAKIIKLAQRQGWGILVEEPDNPDEVPTLLRNCRLIRIVQPIFKFMDVIPGYNEYDVSFWFLLFFSLFFAMIIGDAGYGMIFLAATFLTHRKKTKIPKEVFALFYTLSFSTIIWGALTGTWFGLEQAAGFPFFKMFVIEKINSFLDTNQGFIMQLCFIIGVIHLTIAHAMRFFRLRNSLKALSHLGWIFIGWAMFFIIENVVLDKPLISPSLFLMVSGVVMVALFSDPGRNFLKGIILSLLDMPLKIISYFADILSYLRLFAVGYATVMVAESFNNIAGNIGFSGILAGLVSVVVLFFGHSLNILLGLMSVLVHGVRLNVLEFSSHLNMEWKGKRYSPFRE